MGNENTDFNHQCAKSLVCGLTIEAPAVQQNWEQKVEYTRLGG